MATHIEHRSSGAAALIERLGEELGNNATVKIVFAEPVEQNGVVVIPVAKIRYGFGGRAGLTSQAGGGGGLRATPLGYIEIKNGVSQFRPIFEPMAVARMILGTLFVSMWAASRMSNRRI